MKRAIFTLFQPQRGTSKLGQSALMVLFMWCCFGVSTVDAQIVMKYTKNDTTCTVKKLDPCDGKTQVAFKDDGDLDGNYNDSHARRDTVEICPDNAWSRVKVTFINTFDIEAKDSLVAFDGNKAAVRTNRDGVRIDAGTGQGVSQMNGGWVQASCDPKTNSTGCLTFVFYTDGTNSKGAGWDGWATCEARTAELTLGNIESKKLTCEDPAYGVITIPAPSVKLCGTAATTAQDSVQVIISNQKGDVCIDTCLTNAGTRKSVTDTFAIGIYSVKYILKSDPHPSKQKTATFSVQAPSLVCNDKIDVPFGSSCMIQLTPDDLLEHPCDTITDTMYYNITVTLGTGKNAKTITTTNYDNHKAVIYPIITTADIKAAGMSVCGGTAKVTIERIYYGLGGTATICNNGPQNASCEVDLSFFDQSKPFITLAVEGDTLVACDTTGMDALLKPTAIDNCDDKVDVGYTVRMEETDPCFNNAGRKDTTRAFITFTAKDDCGNVGKLEKTFLIIRPNEAHYADARTPKPRDCKEGDNGSETPGLKIGVIKNGTFQVKDTIHLNDREYICGYILTKRDVNIPSTDCGKKIYRYWSIIDWCESETGPSPIDTTFIEYTDTKAPVFQGEEKDQVIAAQDVKLGPFDCFYDANKHTKPVATDNCDDNVNVYLHAVSRIEDGKPWPITDKANWAKLDCDSFQLMYIADDQCHEQLKNDTTRQIIVVKDVTNPSAICTDELIVSVPSDEGARIYWKDIDAGSYDACGIKKYEIRRKGSDAAWGKYVDVVCTDVHGGLEIELRVTDKQGNTNICWTKVKAEDKIPPVCGDLPDRTYKCDDFHTGELGTSTGGEFLPLTGDLLSLYNSKFGDPATACSDNLSCGILEINQTYKLTELNCGELLIERRWRAADWYPNQSGEGKQTIRVEYKPSWKLTFPLDVDLECGDEFPAAATAADIISNGSCDLWALEVTEKTFEVPGDICMKVERTYELINWCVYEAGDDAKPVARRTDGERAMVSAEGNEEVGRFTYVQVLKLYVNEAPTITLDPVETCIVGVGDVAPFGEADLNYPAYECDTLRTFSASAINCAGVALDSDLFTWKFYVNGVEVDSDKGSSFTKPVEPKNKYKVEFWVSDGCGNSVGDEMEVEFWDCKKPTPYVLHGLAVEIMQTGSIQVWAKDLDQGSFDNCTPKDKLDIRIAKGDPNDGPQDLAGVQALDKNITLTCDDLGTQSVSIYVIDEDNNWDVVGTYIVVQNNMNACSPQDPDGMVGVVAGKITNANGENVESVMVSVNSGDNTMATGATGEFQFQLPLAGDYTITPEKDINPLNGVSTYDLVLISKHILGLQAFDSPYKYIAADVNKSGSITAFDMVQLRQLILNITSEFPNNTSWRFVDAKHEFTTANPAAEDFDEFMSINNFASDMMNVDFIAAKIGDVNGSATANSLLGAESRTTNGTLNLTANDRFVEAGQTVTVDFNATNIATTQGYQFTMNFAGLSLVELTEGVAKAANFNTNLADKGVLTTSWNGEAVADEVLFSVTFTATTNGMLSELVAVSSDVTPAEAYNVAGELLDVNLNFNAANVSAGFELSQNTPNPFNGETLISFNLPKAGMATLKVMDVQGKVLTTITKEGVKGQNQVTLNAKALGATGVLYYQLESADNIATKKMIIIE